MWPRLYTTGIRGGSAAIAQEGCRGAESPFGGPRNQPLLAKAKSSSRLAIPSRTKESVLQTSVGHTLSLRLAFWSPPVFLGQEWPFRSTAAAWRGSLHNQHGYPFFRWPRCSWRKASSPSRCRRAARNFVSVGRCSRHITILSKSNSSFETSFSVGGAMQ